VKSCFVVLLAGILASQVQAQSGHAHVHGEAQVNIIFDESILMLELETPAANLLGFEHTPKNTEESERLSTVSRELESHQRIVKVPDSCQQLNKAIEWPFALEPSSVSEAEEESHSEHDDHDHHHHGDHSVETEQEDSQHKDIRLVYEWQCSKTEMLEFNFELFQNYSGFEKVTVQWIAFGRQNSTVLNANRVILSIEP
jgi:hypothetical protein